MAKRRGHGEGSVYQRTDGRWTAYITLDGNQRKYYYGKTQKEVIEKLQQGQHEKHQGVLVTSPDQSLKTYLAYWLDAYKPTVRLSTYNQRCYVVNSHIIPTLGDISLQRLTPQHVRAFYAKEQRQGIEAQTIRGYHVTLHMALDLAVRDNLIVRNVCDMVDPPKAVKKEMKTLNQEQAQRLLDVVKDQKLEAILTLAITTGMREGEMLALRWPDINIKEGTLSVRRTINRVGKYGIIESEPKTAQGKRQITLPEFVVETLKRHQEKQRAKFGEKWHTEYFVFCNAIGKHLKADSLLEQFERVLKKAGLPKIRFHDLRHSAATLLLVMKIHPKVVQELLGHSSIVITLNTYSHVLPSMHQEAMKKMGELFNGE